jgi:hypothetical protein
MHIVQTPGIEALYSRIAELERALQERIMLVWQNEKTDSEGVRSQAMLYFGAVAGIIMQFPENAPTTYAHHHGVRLGAFESWEAAREVLEKQERDRVGM